jgi:hypothetical protein
VAFVTLVSASVTSTVLDMGVRLGRTLTSPRRRAVPVVNGRVLDVLLRGVAWIVGTSGFLVMVVIVHAV